MKIGLKKEVNKLTYDKTAGDDALMKDKQSVKEDRLVDKSKMLTEKHDDEKLVIALLIVGTGLIAYHF